MLEICLFAQCKFSERRRKIEKYIFLDLCIAMRLVWFMWRLNNNNV